ncbi:hypothetical protein [Mycobacterium asiaticum]|nr:hypothetical protein [Mycobacterium asiaticum]
MRIRATTAAAIVAAAVGVAVAVAGAGPAQAGDPQADVVELQRQTSDLHAAWDSLTPVQRNQRLTQLRQQATIVQNEVDNLPPEQRPEVQARLTQVTLELADILRKVWPVQ